MVSISRAVRVALTLTLLACSPITSASLVGDHTVLRAFAVFGARAITRSIVRCPPNSSVIALNIINTAVVLAKHPLEELVQLLAILAVLPVNGQGISPSADGTHPLPNGVEITGRNDSDEEQTAVAELLCGAEGQFPTTMVVKTTNVPAGEYAFGVAECPAGHGAAGGTYDAYQAGTANVHRTTANASDDAILEVLGHHPHWKAGPDLGARTDGTHEAPTAWRTHVYNPGTTDQTIRTIAFCIQDADSLMQTQVASILLEPGERRFVGIGPTSTDYLYGSGAVGPTEVTIVADAVWRPDDRGIGRGFDFTGGADSYPLGQGGISGVIVRNHASTAFASAAPAATVKLAVIVAPSLRPSPPPTTIIQAIEFYHATSDHYFVTSIPQEISDLDNKVHPGWQRTGESFKVYAAGSGGALGRLPVCRFYGLPQAGLDSHFYTASVLECLDVGVKFAGAWQLEGGEVFQVHFPNITTGACPNGTIPVMRTWNQRVDSNHRLTTKTVIRDSMVKDHGHTAEGYGPNAVVFCALA